MKNICFYPLHSAPSSEEEYVTLESQADRDLSLPDIWEPVASQSRRRGLLILTGKISIIEIPYGDRSSRQVQEFQQITGNIVGTIGKFAAGIGIDAS